MKMIVLKKVFITHLRLKPILIEGIGFKFYPFAIILSHFVNLKAILNLQIFDNNYNNYICELNLLKHILKLYRSNPVYLNSIISAGKTFLVLLMPISTKNYKKNKVVLYLIEGMPSKDKYENFYHWYIMMKQFAPTAIQKWIQKDKTLENDKLIVEILGLLD